MNCNKSTLTGLLFALLAIACIFIIPDQVRVMELYEDELSPRMFPYILSVIVLFFSLQIIWTHRKDAAITFDTNSISPQTLYIFASMAISCVIAAGVYLFGMIAITTAVMLALCVLLGCRNLLALGCMTVGWIVFVYLVFEMAFNFALPKGTLFQ